MKSRNANTPSYTLTHKFPGIKTVFVLLLSATLLSCGGVEQYRSGIESLATDWDATTKDIKTFSKGLNADLAMFAGNATNAKLSDDVVKKLKPDQAQEYRSAETAFVEALQKFAPIRIQIAEFMKAWEGKSSEVQALKEALVAGKLPGDVKGQVAALAHLVSQANESLAGWQASHAPAKAETQSAVGMMQALHKKFTVPGTLTK